MKINILTIVFIHQNHNQYVDNYSFCLDLRIFFATIVKVVRREGINASGEVTEAPFQ